MSQLNPFVRRLIGLFTYWGVLKHPYGREYARQQYTPTGKFIGNVESTRSPEFQPVNPEPAED